MSDFINITQQQFEAQCREHGRAHNVYLHHPILGYRGRLTVQSWSGGLLQRARLDALQSIGYRHRDSWNRTDMRFVEQARRYDGGRLLDHAFFFRHGDDNVIMFHTYQEDIEADVQRVAQAMTTRWRCQVSAQISDQFNFYFPEWGSGFELRRYHRVRAKLERHCL